MKNFLTVDSQIVQNSSLNAIVKYFYKYNKINITVRPRLTEPRSTEFQDGLLKKKNI